MNMSAVYFYLKNIKRRNVYTFLSVVLGCVFLLPLIAYGEIPDGDFFEGVGHAILSATAMLTGTAGVLLNYAISNLVLGMGNALSLTPQAADGRTIIGLGEVINTTWAVLRDICNLAFIFGLIFIGFQTILNVETLNTKKTLVAIIVGALLINFSLFFTKVIIDVSNVLAVEIHSKFTLPDASTLPSGERINTERELLPDDYENYGIAGVFLHNMGLMSFWGSDDLTTFKTTSGGSFSFFFMGMIFLLVAAFVFAAGGIFLIIRFVALILLMIFSPLLFAGAVFPQTQAFAKDLWKKLLAYAFLAPMYLFMLALSARVLGATTEIFKGNLSETLGGTNGTAAVAGFPIILNFTIAIIMLIASLVIAKQMSVAGAEKSVSLLKNAQQRIGQGVWRGTSALPRFVGRESGRLAQRSVSRWLRKGELKTDNKAWNTFKRLPFVTQGLQKAGGNVIKQLEEQQERVKGLRNSQMKRRLDTHMANMGATPLDRLAIYKQFYDKGDIDELDAYQVEDFYNLSKKYGIGTMPIEKERSDVLTAYLSSPEAIKKFGKRERPVAKMKNAADTRKIHKVNVAIEGEGTRRKGVTDEVWKNMTEEQRETERGFRREQVKKNVDEWIEFANGSMLQGFIGRQDEVTEAVAQRLAERMKIDPGKMTAEKVAGHFDNLAREEAAKGANANNSMIARHQSAAKYMRTGPAGRLFNRDVGSKSQGTRGAVGDEDDEDPYDSSLVTG